jgi:hypothetical protein
MYSEGAFGSDAYEVDTTNYIRDGGDDVSTGFAELLFENAKGESLGEPGESSATAHRKEQSSA